MFEQSFINKVSAASDIIDIVSRHTHLKPQSNGSFVGLCPYPDHQEKTPSFSVSETKQVYYCFGCKKSGNIFTFLKEIQGMPFTESVEFLANRASLPLERAQVGGKVIKQRSEAQKKESSSFLKVNQKAMEFFKNELNKLSKTNVVWKYLKKRNLTLETIDEFQIGYAPNRWVSLIEFLKKEGLPLEGARKLGLIQTKESKEYDTFRNRLIFPIFSNRGDVVGFGGRQLDDKPPKYINSSESAIFHKRATLYGLNKTAKFIRADQSALVVEGYTDLISLYQSGVKNVVATLGTALTEAHIRELQKLTNNVVLLFDGDESGEKAAEKTLPLFLKSSVFAKVLVLPNNQDPDEFIQKSGVKPFKVLLARASDLFYRVVDKYFKNYQGDASQKIFIIDKIAPLFQAIKEPRLKSLYLKELADRFQTSEQWLLSAIAKSKDTKKNTFSKNSQPLEKEVTNENVTGHNKICFNKLNKAERDLLKIALVWEDIFLDMPAKKRLFVTEEMKWLVEKALELYEEVGFTRLPGVLFNFLDSAENLISQGFEVEMLDKNREINQSANLDREEARQLQRDCWHKLEQIHHKEQVNHLRQSLNFQPNLSQERLNQFMELQKKMKV